MKNLIAVALSVAGLSAFGGGGSVDSAGSCVSFSSAASAVGFCAASAAAPLRIVIPTPAKVCFSGEEFETDGLPEISQKSEDQKYDPAGRRSFSALVKEDNRSYVKIDGESLGHVRNCTFRNIAVFAEPGVPPPSIRVMSRTPPGGEMRPFENVTLEGFSINGKAADWNAFSFTTNTPIALRP